MTSSAPEAGPSGSKRPRFRPHPVEGAQAASLPTTLDVEKFALARGLEISAMERAMKASRDSGAQRAFQSLPRHLRRRAASHNIRRLPKRLRAKAKIEMLQDNAKVLKKKKFRQLSIAKRRKLLRGTRLELLHGRQMDKAWLETHIWHAKRMKMSNIWGYRLASTPTDKAFRPSYRSSRHGVIAHDASYLQTIELSGTLESLSTHMSMFCDLAGPPPWSKRYTAGTRQCSTHLYNYGTYPLGLIGPASIIWKPPTTLSNATSAVSESDESIRQVMLRFHPSILVEVTKLLEIRRSEDSDLHPPSANLYERGTCRPWHKVSVTHRNFCTFEITGPMATDALKASIRLARDSEEVKVQAWRDLGVPAAVPQGLIFSLNVQDPRLNFPPSLPKGDHSYDKRTFIQPSNGLASNDLFWDAQHRKKLAVPTFTKKQLDQRRSRNLIPATRLEPGPDDNVVPIMLIQRTIESIAAEPSTSTSSPQYAITGWTLIVPSGWGTAFWYSLAFADARIGGLRERAQQYFESGVPNFPLDYACTSAYYQEIKGISERLSTKWNRTPPAKRVNFAKLGSWSPWKPSLGQLLHHLTLSIPIDSLPPNVQVGDVRLADSNSSGCYLLTGSFVTLLLAKVQEELQRNLHLPTHVLQDILHNVIEQVRKKRNLHGLQPAELMRAFVKVRMTPVSRGSPKYGAYIYCPGTPEELSYWIGLTRAPSRDQIHAPGRRFKTDEKSQAAGAGQNNVSIFSRTPTLSLSLRHDDSINTDDDDADGSKDGYDSCESCSCGGDKDSNEMIHRPGTRLEVGRVTTGNMSLARGKGQGFGVISLLALARMMTTELEAKVTKRDPKHLVLFRNTASRVTRLATLEILQ